MGKRGASAAAASGADDGPSVDEAEDDDLKVRHARWRSEHPTRAYFGATLAYAWKDLRTATQGSPQIPVGAYKRIKTGGGGVSSAASGEPAEWAISHDIVGVPFAQKVVPGEEVKKLGQHDELFVYRDSASGEMFRHATSMERVSALATTHPLVSTLNPVPENVHEDRVLDARGLAISGEQSNIYLSLSLAVCGKVIILGISTYNVAEDVCGL